MDELLEANRRKRMKRNVLRSACLLTLLIVLAGVQLKPLMATAGQAKADDEVRAVLDAQVVAWNKGDLDGFMLGYWKSDELTFYADDTIEKGYEPLKQRYHKRYKAEGKEMGKLTFADVEIQVPSATFSVVRGKWKVEKSKETANGLFTLWVEKKPDGWRIVHDHTSAKPSPK